MISAIREPSLSLLPAVSLTPIMDPNTDQHVMSWRTEYNRYRAEHAPPIPPALWHQAIALIAQWKAEDMMARGYFSHYTPEGWGPWDLARMAGIRGYVAECIGFGYREAAPLLEGYKASPTHLQVLEDDRFSHHGTGTVWGPWKGGGEARAWSMFWIGGLS
jgi:uncharacterized protein YkwD